jgi:hypothetical protein
VLTKKKKEKKNMAWTTKFDRRPTSERQNFSPIKSLNSVRKAIKKNLEITKSILYINFVKRILRTSSKWAKKNCPSLFFSSLKKIIDYLKYFV